MSFGQIFIYMEKLRILSSKLRVLRRLKPRQIFEAVVLACLVVGFIIMSVAILSGKWQIRPILSGSMQPGFSIGGVAITQTIPTSQLKVGDVAVFHPPFMNSTTYIHRIISISKSNNHYIIQTKGDDNPTKDPWLLQITSKNSYITRFTLPFIGYLAVWVHSYSGRKVLLTIAGVLVIIFLMTLSLDIEKKRRNRKNLTENSKQDIKQKPKREQKNRR